MFTSAIVLAAVLMAAQPAYATAPGDFSDIVRTQNRTSDI